MYNKQIFEKFNRISYKRNNFSIFVTLAKIDILGFKTIRINCYLRLSIIKSVIN